VRALAGRQGVTFFSAMLTAFQMVMANAAGKDDILVGSPVANRGKKAIWDTMGSFAGIVPLRSRLDRGRTLSAQLGETHQMTVDSMAHALPFVELVKCLGEEVVPGRNPVFDVRFALQNHPVPDVSMPGMEVDYRTRSTGTCRFDLACELTEIRSSLEVVWLYRDDLFSPAEVELWHRQFTAMLDGICGGEDARLSELMNRLP
jgi:non-ribosomal peptide synthetase component F